MHFVNFKARLARLARKINMQDERDWRDELILDNQTAEQKYFVFGKKKGFN